LEPGSEHSTAARSNPWPAVFVVGVLLLVAGIAFTWIVVAIGAIVVVGSAVLWVRRVSAAGDLLRTGDVEPERRPVGRPENGGYATRARSPSSYRPSASAR